MRILITGITGFIGEHLGRELLERGHEVHGLLRYVSNRDVSYLSGINLYYGDIREEDTVKKVFEEIGPEVVVHLAAQTSVHYSFERPREAYNVNFIGVINTAKAAMDTPEVMKFIHASSVEVYGNQKKFPIREDAPLSPASPYGVAKVAAEYYLKYLYDAYDFPHITFRSANTYGRKNNHVFVVEHIIYQLLTGEKILLGDPFPVRDLLYVDDEVDAYIKAIETKREIFGEVMNTGTGRGVSIQELFEIIEQLTGIKKEVVWNVASKRPFEIEELVMDIEKIRRRLDWKPKHSLEEGLTKTINWWRKKVG